MIDSSTGLNRYRVQVNFSGDLGAGTMGQMLVEARDKAAARKIAEDELDDPMLEKMCCRIWSFVRTLKPNDPLYYFPEFQKGLEDTEEELKVVGKKVAFLKVPLFDARFQSFDDLDCLEARMKIDGELFRFYSPQRNNIFILEKIATSTS